MEDLELITLWKSYDQKLSENLMMSKKIAADITTIKVKSLLNTMRPIKIFTLVIGFLWVMFLFILITRLFFMASPFFIVSAGAVALLNTIALMLYLYQIILLHQVDINKPVLEMQEKIAGLKASTIWIARILMLQLPFWTTFYWNQQMFNQGNFVLWVIQIVITAAFALLAVWLFLNIDYKNKNKRWFKLMFDGKEWDPVIKSMDMLEQINEYKN